MNKKAKAILRPLYIWAFIEALVFWYAIEKLLWSSSGISPSQIILLGIIAQSSQVLIEVPSSIIADRWSRRKTLITSSVFMLLATTVALIAQTFYSFLIMCLVWAFYYSFQSGTTNAYTYDLLQEQGQQSQYRKAVSRLATFQLCGLIVSSLAASALVACGNLLSPYWATLVPTSIAIVLMWRMRDPPIERTEQSTGTAHNHVRSAIRNIAAKKWLCVIFVALAFVTAGRFIWYEYYQLYALQQHVLPVLFGILGALIYGGNILGSEIAHRMQSPNKLLIVALGVLLLSTIGLAFASGSLIIICLLILSFFGSQACSIVFDESLQHETSSELRATTLSLASLASRIIFGICAAAIIFFGTTPKIIALVTLVAFICAMVYAPVRRHLLSAEQH